MKISNAWIAFESERTSTDLEAKTVAVQHQLTARNRGDVNRRSTLPAAVVDRFSLSRQQNTRSQFNYSAQTRTGDMRVMVVPSPSRPEPLRPNAHTVRSGKTSSEKESPAEKS